MAGNSSKKTDPTLLWGTMTNELSEYIYQTAKLKGHWTTKKKGLSLSESIACIHAHISRMWRNGNEADPDMPEMTAFEAGLADTIIELMEWCGAHRIDLGHLILKRATHHRKLANKYHKEKKHDWETANAEAARLQ